MAGDSDKSSAIGAILSAVFIISVIGVLIFAFIGGALKDSDNPSSGTNPTVNDQPFTEPNFDNLDSDGLINGQR